MTNENPRGQKNDPTDRSIETPYGEDSDASADQPETTESKGCAGLDSCSEANAGDAKEPVYDSTDQLPDSWDAVDADRPRNLCSRVTPQDLERAAAEADTLLELTMTVRAQRRPTRKALVRLGLVDAVPSAGPAGLLTGGAD